MIEATELIDVHLSGDGKHLRLRFRDQDGQAVTLSLPAGWLNCLLNALPGWRAADGVHRLDSWSMERLDNDQGLLLTLCTPEGQAVSFAVKPWQIAGMATLASYGPSAPRPERTFH